MIPIYLYLAHLVGPGPQSRASGGCLSIVHHTNSISYQDTSPELARHVDSPSRCGADSFFFFLHARTCACGSVSNDFFPIYARSDWARGRVVGVCEANEIVRGAGE